MEQIITELCAKCLHIILESRTPCISSRNFSGEQTVSSPSSSSSSSSSVRPRDKSFNLALRECPEALENLDLCCQSNLEPLVVDVVLVKRAINWDQANFYPKTELFKNLSSKELHTNCWNSEELGNERSEKIIERWIVQYEAGKAKDAGKGSKRSSSNILSSIYKKSDLLLRSLYLTVRLLPAYKIFRDLNSTGQICSFSLAHRVSSFAEPFTRREEAEMQQFGFAPVDTSSGSLCLSVLYRSSLSDVSSEPSTPMSPQLIPDYVGSPLAGPFKRFPSLPVSHGSPSSLPFSRRHNWSFDQYHGSPPSVTFSPSPTHSEPYASASNASSCRFPPPLAGPFKRFPSLPVSHGSPSSSPFSRRHNWSFDQYHGSPPSVTFSPSPTHSEPYASASNASSCRFPPPGLPHHPPGVSHALKDNVTDPGSRVDLFDKRRHAHDPLQSGSFLPITKSPVAAVGVLVDMLKNAPPLHQDFSNMATASQASRSETWSNSFHKFCQTPKAISAQDGTSSIASSALLTSKTTADALEELEGYKEMKNLLLSQGGTSRSQSVPNYAAAAVESASRGTVKF